MTMRKIFLTSTALMGAAALSTPAFADGHETGVQITAFSQWVASVGSNDSAIAGGDSNAASNGTLQSNSEIHFNWSKTSDTGITYGLRVEMEADQGNAGIDENGIFFSTSYGTIKLEQDDGAGDTKITGTGVGVAYGQSANPTGSDLDNVRGPNGARWGNANDSLSAPTGVGLSMDGGDDPKVSYYIPEIIPGLTAGISYAPNGAVFDNAVGIGVTYAVPVGERFSLDLAGAFASADYVSIQTGTNAAGPSGQDGNADGFTIGAQLGVAGFTIAAGYSDEDIDGNVTQAANSADVEVENQAYSFGVSYGFGPVSVNAVYNNVEQNRSTAGGASLTDDLEELSAGISYNILPGVTIEASALTGEVEDQTAVNTETDLDFETFTAAVRTSW